MKLILSIFLYGKLKIHALQGQRHQTEQRWQQQQQGEV